jgi:copper chaperone CopZ
MTPLEFASALMAYCAATRGSVTSWGRTPLHNAQVGGVADSAHLIWTGADVVYDTTSLSDVQIRSALAARLGLMLIAESDHDHMQPTRSKET